MHRLVLTLPAVLVVAACAAGSGGAATAAPSAAATTATVTAPTTTGGAATAVDTDLAVRLAALACDNYVSSRTLSAAEGSGPLDDAAATATSAAVVDPTWTDLAGALAFVAALPLTDVAAEDQARVSTQTTVIQGRCGDAGVTVS